MTAPFAPPVKLPNQALGNTALDISKAAAGFLGGIHDEQQQRREEAMRAAMMQLEASRIGLVKPTRTTARMVNPATGVEDLVTGWQYPPSIDHPRGYFEPAQVEGGGLALAPSSVMQIPTLDAQNKPDVALQGRYTPNAPAKPIELPPGQTVRPPPPRIVTAAGPQGPEITRVAPYGPTGPVAGGAGGTGLQPKATVDQEQRARYSFQIIQSRSEMNNIVKSDPGAASEAAAFIASLDLGQGIPLVGNTVEAFIQSAQSALSPGAAQYFRAFMLSAAALAFSQGGKQLTNTEKEISLATFSPRVGEDPSTTAQRDRLLRGYVTMNTAGNPAWQVYAPLVTQFGWSPEENTNLAPPPFTPPNAPPTGPAMNPRFAPRKVRP